MSLPRIEHLKSELIKRELETTPWEALVDLASKKIQLEVSEMSIDELERESLKAFGQFEIDLRKTVKRLAEYKMVTATTLEVVEHVRQALEREYQLIPIEDLETLYRLFMGGENGGLQAAPLATLSKEI